MSEHATLAPSAASRWIACPGSVRLSRTIPNVETDYAAEGTFAHHIAAECLRESLDAANLIGYRHGGYECDAEMAGYVQEYLDVVRGLCDDEPSEAGTFYESAGDDLDEPKVFAERRVRLSPTIWGTADAIVWLPETKTLHVLDFKYGAGVFVPVEGNVQLGIYAAAAVSQMADTWGSAQTVVTHIVQPRHHRGGHHQTAIPIETLETWVDNVVLPAADATEAPDASFAAGDHCRFCDAKAVCPELKRSALATTRDLFDDETLTPAKTPPPPSLLTPVEISNALAAFPVVEQWIKAVRETAYGIATAGGSIPGHKVVQKTGRRKWRDDAEAEFVLDLFDVSPFTDPKLVSPAVAEKRLPRDSRAIMQMLAIKPSTGTVLVPDSDARPAHNAADVFVDDPA